MTDKQCCQGEGYACCREQESHTSCSDSHELSDEQVRYKNTIRRDELINDITRRINRATGQLNGIKNMVENNRYCGDVLTQLAAVESAVGSIARLLLKDHIETCVMEKMSSGDKTATEELMALMKKFM